MFTLQDEYWMQRALALAQLAALADEVPVGAVLVHDGELIAEGFNCPISTSDPSAHAEIVTLRAAANAIGNYRLVDTTLYVTLEPCLMCAGAIVHSRVQRLVYGATDPRAGAVATQIKALDFPFLNHHTQHCGGLLAAPCGQILSNFFRHKRSA